MEELITENDHSPFSTRNINGKSHLFFTCDHASNSIPGQLHSLGLTEEVLLSHSGWDIGALEVSSKLSDDLDTPLVYTNYSRLVIDCNRPPGSPESIPEQIHGIDIPGNKNLEQGMKKKREDEIFTPYHRAIHLNLHNHIQHREKVCFLAIHSFTPRLKGKDRPWEVGITYKTPSLFSRYLLRELKRNFAKIGENEPYPITPDGDYGMHNHGEKNNLESVLIEIRQDLLENEKSKGEIIEILSNVLYRFDVSLGRT